MEHKMSKSFFAIAAALAIASLGSLTSSPAQAGNGAPGGASKYGNVHAANVEQVRHPRSVQTANYPITEFSSSSASGPKR
jgi:hypothetical protein